MSNSTSSSTSSSSNCSEALYRAVGAGAGPLTAGLAAVMLGLCLLPRQAPAARVQSLSVTSSDGRYSVDLLVGLNAGIAAVYRVLTNYSRLSRLNPSIRYTRLLPTPEGAPPRLKSRIHMCVLIYCRDLVQVQEMHAHPPGWVRAVIVPEKSDFEAGVTTWRLTAQPDGDTTMHLHTRMDPAFWVPPLIGPWLIRKVLRSEAVTTAHALEQAARAAGT